MGDSSDPAFPRLTGTDPTGEYEWGAPGITQRDYFAAAALNGLLAYFGTQVAISNFNSETEPEKAAKAAYRYADAMLEERAKP